MLALKYPRRSKRTVGGTTYKIAPPDDSRSRTMSQIRSGGTSIEKLFAGALRKNKIKYRSGKKIFGKPDFILLGYRVAIFCDGDFWHGFCLKKNKVKTNPAFWNAKIKRNIERDREVNRELKKKGWEVFRFWEHNIKKNPDKCIEKIKKYIVQVDKE